MIQCLNPLISINSFHQIARATNNTRLPPSGLFHELQIHIKFKTIYFVVNSQKTSEYLQVTFIV